MNLARVGAWRADQILIDNGKALDALRVQMENLRTAKPRLFDEYERLLAGKLLVQCQVERIKQLRSKFNPLGICDAAACLVVGPWAFDVFIFSRKIGAWKF